MDNSDIAAILNRIADILEIQEADRFRIRAYRMAALTVQDLPQRLEDLVRADRAALDRLPGIGERLREKLIELVTTGTLTQYQRLQRAVPPGLLELLQLHGLGPKTVKLLRQRLGITDLASLERACLEGKVADLEGMGLKTQQKILQALQHYRQTQGRLKLHEAERFAASLIAYLRRQPVVQRVEIAGSLRRGKETIGDLDLLAMVSDPEQAAKVFVAYNGVDRVLARGPSKCSVVLTAGLQVDLRMMDPPRFGAALVYFTGSKAHNIRIRTIAKQRRLKINEYGVFRVRSNARIAGRTEEEVYRALGMEWIPPELREDRGEVEAAQAGRLPRLIEAGDIKGDLHAHTTATDGRHTILEMAQAAKARGLDYLAITDHTKSTRVAGGLTDREFLRHIQQIRRVAARVRGITILCGAEVDILPDGRLDLGDTVLRQLEVVVASVHSHFTMPREQMTRRILKALEHPRVHILGHPTGRLIGARKPYDVDIEAVFRAARERGVLLEINAQPDRMDLSDACCKAANEANVRCVISTDAHSTLDFGNLRYGVIAARRGWLEPDDVANTLPPAAFRKALRRPS
jgi:DNA polymerase (family 10)